MQVYYFTLLRELDSKEVADRFYFLALEMQHYSEICLYFRISFTFPRDPRNICYSHRGIPEESAGSPSSPFPCSSPPHSRKYEDRSRTPRIAADRSPREESSARRTSVSHAGGRDGDTRSVRTA